LDSQSFSRGSGQRPRIVYSNEMAVELVSGVPGAVAFVDAEQVPKGLKV